MNQLCPKVDQYGPTAAWLMRDAPRELIHRIKVAAAVQRKTFRQLVPDLAEVHLEELERK